MNFIRNLFIFIIVCQLSHVINCDKVKVINLSTWNLSNENGSEFLRNKTKSYKSKLNYLKNNLLFNR